MGSSNVESRPGAVRASIISPVADLLLVGGLSLLVFVPLLLSGRDDLLIIGVGAQAWLALFRPGMPASNLPLPWRLRRILPTHTRR